MLGIICRADYPPAMRPARVLLLNVAGLATAHLKRKDLTPNLNALLENGFSIPLRPSFPAVTCSVQATLLSGRQPDEHGIIANGFFDHDSFEAKFWEQPSSLVQAPRLWDILKHAKPSLTTATLFWQNTMFINSDIVVTPRPLHLEGKMVQWCYSKPAGFYEELAKDIGEFRLQTYWGPMASLESSQWITKCIIETLKRKKPDVTLAYLPHLDYSSQKFGPQSPQAIEDVKKVDALIGEIVAALDKMKLRESTAICVVSEYTLMPVSDGICLNRILRDAGLLAVREIGGKEYIDYELSGAFAMVDHQVAHIFCNGGAAAKAREALEGVAGIELILEGEEKSAYRIDHPRSGDLIAVASPDKWFAYYWWNDEAKAPEFVHTVDIHRKPGFDPCELFFDPKIRGIPTEPSLVKGSHGRPPSTTEEMAVFLASGPMVKPHKPPETMEATQVTPTICNWLGIRAGTPAKPVT